MKNFGTCDQCGREIQWNGTMWEHCGATGDHAALPDPASLRDKPERVLVFVYGTLRKDCGNHGRLGLDKVPFIGEGQVRGLALLDAGAPMAIPANCQSLIVGEVYEVTADVLRNLDRLESYDASRSSEDNWYNREGVNVKLASGEMVRALAYIQRFHAKRYAKADPVIGGDWKAYGQRGYRNRKEVQA